MRPLTGRNLLIGQEQSLLIVQKSPSRRSHVSRPMPQVRALATCRPITGQAPAQQRKVLSLILEILISREVFFVW